MKKVHYRVLFTLTVVILILAGLYLVPPAEIEKIKTALFQFSYPVLTLTLGLSALQVLGMALRFWFLLPSPRCSFRAVASAIVNGHFVNAFAPARAGEAVKIIQLNKGVLKIPLAQATGTFAVDKIIDLAAILTLWIIFQPVNLTPQESHSIPLYWIAIALVLIGLAIGMGRKAMRRFQPHWEKFRQSLFAIRDYRKSISSFAVGVLVWGLELLALHTLCQSQGYALSASQLMTVLVALNLSISVGASVANVGTFEAPIVFVLGHFGVPTTTALAIAVIHHLLQWLAIGLVAGFFSLKNKRAS